MTLDEYEKHVMRTMNSDDDQTMLKANYALGLAGEAGEVADLIKKYVFHGVIPTREYVVEELGDVLWYVTAMALTYGMDLAEVAAKNVAKLQARYPDGFVKGGGKR